MSEQNPHATFDPQAARQALQQAVRAAMAQAPGTEEIDRPLTARMRAALDLDMPAACFMASEAHPDGVYVPAWLLDLAAQEIFGDRWSSEVLETEIVKDDRDGIRFEARGAKPVEKTVHRVVAKARVAVEVRSPGGRTQRHVAVGISVHDVPWGSADVQSLYKIAVKGAATDARRTALAQFGRIFSPRGSDLDAILAQASSASLKAQEEARRAPAKTVARRVRAQRPGESYAAIDETGATLETYPGTAEGALQALDSIGEILAGCANPEIFEAAREANAATVARIEAEHGAALGEAIAALKARIQEATAAQAGFGAPAPSRRAARKADSPAPAGNPAAAAAALSGAPHQPALDLAAAPEDRLAQALAAIEAAKTVEQVQEVLDTAVGRTPRMSAKAILRLSEAAAARRQAVKAAG
jgi:hypothetical protein